MEGGLRPLQAGQHGRFDSGARRRVRSFRSRTNSTRLRECFRIGLAPTGSKDPFALRRAAQGIVKILFEAKLPLNLLALVEDIPELASFIRERIEFYLRDVLDFAYDEVNAVMAAPIESLPDVAERAEAIHYIRPTEDFEPLAASFKRIKNILKQAHVTDARAARSKAAFARSGTRTA